MAAGPSPRDSAALPGVTPRRRGAAVVVALLLALIGAVGAATPAEAAGYDGYCRDANGVTVVVDFQALGGGIVIRCAPTASGGTGLSALQDAGVGYEGVRRWGDAFICRMYGRPAAGDDLGVTGRPGYREQCIDTPPPSAYWGYWYAADGGSWQYSQYGVKNRRVVAGGFEGWSFSLNATTGSGPSPRVTPSRPAAASSPSRTSPRSTAPAGTTTPAAPVGSTSGRAATTGGSSGSPAGGPAGATSPSTTALPQTLPSTGPADASGSGAGGLVVDSDALAASGPTGSSGPGAATLVGAGLLAFLVVAGAGTALRRRRE